MAEMTALDLAILAGLALAISLAVAWLSGRVAPPRPVPAAPGDAGGVRHFLFRDGALIDSDAPDFLLPDAATPDEADWSRFRRWLAPRFAVPGTVTQDITLSADTARLTLRPHRGALRVTLADSGACAAERHGLLARLRAREDHARALFAAPLPLWLRGASGAVCWQNGAALALAAPDRARLLEADGPGRVALDEPPRWYELARVPQPDGGEILYATDITATVLAEQSQRDFVQTLARTFADLPTGLAVFDRSRALAMFNPALTDLTGLDPVFLSNRPEIFDFFDRLRDRQVMPEPRNYASWRAQIAAMIRAADDGQYQEVWSLANGRTYRVTGRPHPNGAVAFLLADISDEVASTRDQRAALELRQAALDHVGEGVAVLDRDGTLLFCNRRFAGLARLAPEARANLPLAELLAACRARFPRVALWNGVEARMRAGATIPFTDCAPLGSGASLSVRLMPLGQGQTMLVLHHQGARTGTVALSA
ncbi:MAG: PAS-domain containing protein [Roseovarius sp.]|nr:PAS-domain containing protein [Roseovarius sp.]